MIKIIKTSKYKTLIFVLSFFAILSMLRGTLIPLSGDEITYENITENIFSGKYFLNDSPSTVTPVVPFIMALFKTNSKPEVGYILNKIFNIFLSLLGLRFCLLFFIRQNIKKEVALSIAVLTMCTSICINYFGTLYPESIVFFCFWGFLYYSSVEINSKNFLKMFSLFIILFLSRYLYIVLGGIILVNYYNQYKNNKVKFSNIIYYSLLLLIPLFVWVKYVHNIEVNNLSNLTYFSRFNGENPIWYNVKSGLGLIKHYEVNRVNGVPAFVSLFIPVTGIRNFIVSIILIVLFLIGFHKNTSSFGIKILLGSIVFIMLGLIFAGTGFSRYWLPLLPGFYLGYYFLSKKLKLKEHYFINLSYLASVIYLANELRLNYVIINQYILR